MEDSIRPPVGMYSFPEIWRPLHLVIQQKLLVTVVNGFQEPLMSSGDLSFGSYFSKKRVTGMEVTGLGEKGQSTQS